MTVVSLLSGATTDTSAVVVSETGAASTSCRVAYSTSPSLSSPSYTAAAASDAQGYVKRTLSGLTADTHYYYAVEVGGVLDAARGHFRTHPAPAGTACSFTIVQSCCQQGSGPGGSGTTGPGWGPSTHPVFSRIAERDPLMFVHLGDIHYKNISVNDQDAYRLGIRQSITASPAVDAFRNVALAYIYDDHDFGANNSDSTAPGRPAAAAVYRQATPHYPLAGAGAAYQAWTIGRVRFIMTDLRYERSPNSDTDNASKTMLGATQKAWLKAELLAAKDFPVTVWLNTQIWSVASFVLDDDHWGVFNTERVEISNYLATNGITNVMQLTGDQHALGYKLAADYSTAQTAPMNIYCGASLDSPPLVRGANWDQVDPPGVGRGRYATLTVSDIGTRVTVAWEGWAVDPDTGAESLVMAHDFTVGELGSAVARVWDGRRWVRRNVRTVEDNQWVARPVNA